MLLKDDRHGSDEKNERAVRSDGVNDEDEASWVREERPRSFVTDCEAERMRRRLCPHKHRANMSTAPTATGMPPAFTIVQAVLLILALIPIVSSVDLNSRTVKTKYGDLKGVIVKLERNLGGVEVFRGVPYASPPVGSLRFMPPVNGAPWHGVKVADKFGPVCPQKLPELTNAMPPGRMEYLRRLLPLLRNQSEDCLYLNIYAPAQGMW